MPPWSRRAISSAVTSLPTLATTIGESDVAAAPSIVVPEARCRIVRPSCRTVTLAAGLRRASSSTARLVTLSTGAGTVVVVVLVVVVVVVLVVVVVVDGVRVVAVVAGGAEVMAGWAEVVAGWAEVVAAVVGDSADEAAVEHPVRISAVTAIAERR